MAHDNLKKVRGKQKTYYDRRARSHKFKVGDKVLLLLLINSYYTGKVRLKWSKYLIE